MANTQMTFGSINEGIKYFVTKYGNDLARAISGTGIYFGVAVAQMCHESGFGTSYNAVNRNNFGGIMSKGKYVVFATPYDCFKFYANTLLSQNHPYVQNGLLTASTPKKQLKAIADGGYCADPPAQQYYTLVGKMLDRVNSLYDTGKVA